MMNHMKAATVSTPAAATYDEYCEKQSNGTPATRTITIVISLKTGATQTANNVKAVDSDYIGVTSDKDLKEDEEIVQAGSTYTVKFADTTGRMTIAYLKLVKQYGN